jgi:transcriptional regulator with XRE-family HTH domain
MNGTESGRQGEHRRLTPAEIGNFVLRTRTERKIKRASLAADANLSDKTLERLEAGERVGDPSYQQMALALGLPKDLFTAEAYVPTPEEAVQMVNQAQEEFLRSHLRVVVAKLRDPRQLLSLYPGHGVVVDDSHVAAEHAEAVALVKELLVDWGDILDEIPHTAQLDAAKQILEHIGEIERHGYSAFGGTARNVEIENGVQFKMVLVVFFPSKDAGQDRRDVWIPKRMSMF